MADRPKKDRPSVAEYHALNHALERTEEDLALVLGVLAGMWPSSLSPLAGGKHHRIVIDTPAGEISFTIRASSAKRMWHIPEAGPRKPDPEATRFRDERLMQLASGIAPCGPMPTFERPTEPLRVTDRRNPAVRQEATRTGEPT